MDLLFFFVQPSNLKYCFNFFFPHCLLRSKAANNSNDAGGSDDSDLEKMKQVHFWRITNKFVTELCALFDEKENSWSERPDGSCYVRWWWHFLWIIKSWHLTDLVQDKKYSYVFWIPPFLQEILEEVRKELQKVKEEIIGGKFYSFLRTIFYFWIRTSVTKCILSLFFQPLFRSYKREAHSPAGC